MNPMTSGKLSIWLRVLRRIIRSGTNPGWRGHLGRWVGLNIGWPLYGGVRLQIEDANEAIQSLALKFQAYEPNLAFIIGNSLREGDLFIDVGGNIGNHTLIAAGSGAEVIVFEPLARLADRIEASLKLNRLQRRVKVHRNALGAEQSVGTLNVAKRSDDGSHSLISGVEAESVEGVSVQILPLDDVLGTSATPAFIKVDVEGYEARVIDGAARVLDASEPPIWLIETADRLADGIGESASTVLQRFKSRGYELWRVPDYGRVEKQVSTVDGELSNYCAVHPKSRIRLRVLDSLSQLQTGE